MENLKIKNKYYSNTKSGYLWVYQEYEEDGLSKYDSYTAEYVMARLDYSFYSISPSVADSEFDGDYDEYFNEFIADKIEFEDHRNGRPIGTKTRERIEKMIKKELEYHFNSAIGVYC